MRRVVLGGINRQPLLSFPRVARQFSQANLRHASETSPFPRIVGSGEAKTVTPQPPKPPKWYKNPRIIKTWINIWLLMVFADSVMLISYYKSSEREITWKSKDRMERLQEAIDAVRKGEPIKPRIVLGNTKLESARSLSDGIFMACPF
jgi:hypothetical protein